MTAAETTHRAELELGPPIVGGLVRWCSSTLITGADHNSEGGCLRRTWLERVGGQERETTPQMTAGVGMHQEIQEYLDTGRMMLGPVARAGLHYIPTPGPGLSVERPIILGGNGAITGVWLRAAGVPVAGHVDLFNHRGEYLDGEGELRRDPAGTLEVKDWKSTSDLKWAKNAEQVSRTIQMTTYAMGGFRIWPSYERARLTHVYFQRNGRPQARLATKLVERREVERRWEYAEAVMRRVVDAARETDPSKVEPNTRACRSYNRDCPHLHMCAEGRRSREQNSLEDVLGERGAERVLARMRGEPDNTEHDEGSLMSLFDLIAPESTEASSLDALLAEETAARVALDPPPPAPIPATAEFTAAIGVINSSPLGFPKLTGRAAVMFGTLNKHDLKNGMEIPARGKLEKLAAIEDPDGVVSLAAEVAKKFPASPANGAAAAAIAAAAKAAPTVTPITHNAAPVAILPPDAPASSPALAADPVDGLDNAKSRELAAARSTGAEIPGLAETAALLAGAAPGGLLPEVATVAAAMTTIAQATPATIAAAASTPATPTEAPAPKKAAAKKTKVDGNATAGFGTAISIFVDVFVEGTETTSLAPYVRALCDTLCAEYGAVKDGNKIPAADVRCAPQDSPLGFAKWRGAVSALAAKSPPPPGAYHVDTRGDEVAELVAVALRDACVASGGTYARSSR